MVHKKGVGNMRKLILSFFLLGLSMSSAASAQPAVDRPLDSNMKAGQLFTVKIVPNDKLIDVFIAGNETAKLDLSGTDLIATLKVGRKSWVLTPKRTGDGFSVVAPAEVPIGGKSELKLLLKQGKKTETFHFQLRP